MAGFGEKLRTAREQKGLSIETIEEETKIRKLYLEALEKEAFTLLPARVYAVGFVKSYAQFLGLDVEEISREFKEIAYGAGEEEMQVPRAPAEKSSILERMPVRNLFFAMAFLLLAIWVGNYLIDYISSGIKRTEVGKAPPTVNEKNNLPQPDKTSPEPQPARDTLDMAVKVKPDQKCWVLVRVDGEQRITGILEPNQQESFSAKESIYIKVGNAAAIDIIINDKKLEPLGGPGEVKEKEFIYGREY